MHEDVSNYHPFKVPYVGYSCSVSGESIPEGGVLYHRNRDLALSGSGICQAVYDAALKASQPVSGDESGSEETETESGSEETESESPKRGKKKS